MALSIISYTPDDGDTLVDLNQIIEVEFTDDIDSKTINSSSFMVYEDNVSIHGITSYLARRKTATFKPDDKFKPDTEYRVVLSNRIKSITGDNLQGDLIFRFKTKEAEYELNKPVLLYPADKEKVNNSVIKWSNIDLAESYSVEISDRPDFNNIVFSTIVIEDNKVIANIDTEKEYYVRVKANDIFADDPKKTRIILNTNKLNYYGQDYYEINIGLEYCPLYSINRVYLEEHGELNIIDDGKSEDGECFILSPTHGTLAFHKNLPEGKYIYIDLEYLPSRKNSDWSDVLSFYYQKETIDFEEIINSLDGDNVKDLIDIENKIQVNTDSNYIYIKLNSGDLTIDNIENIEIEGVSINHSPYIESHGVLNTNINNLEFIDSFSNYCIVRYTIDNLLENNEYTVTITINGRKYSDWFLTKLNPLYTTVQAVRNSDIGYLLTDISDKEIILKLYEISSSIKDIANENDYTWEDGEVPPATIRRLVLVKAKYNLLLYKNYLSNQQFDSFSLADFDVSSIDYSRIEPLMNDLKEEIKNLEDKIVSKTSARSVLKGENQSPYPFEDRNSF